MAGIDSAGSGGRVAAVLEVRTVADGSVMAGSEVAPREEKGAVLEMPAVADGSVRLIVPVGPGAVPLDPSFVLLDVLVVPAVGFADGTGEPRLLSVARVGVTVLLVVTVGATVLLVLMVDPLPLSVLLPVFARARERFSDSRSSDVLVRSRKCWNMRLA